MKKTKAKKHTGRPPRHGGYSIMIRMGELPERRAYLRGYLTRVREGLIRDMGPAEEDLTTAERVVLDRAVSTLSVIRCIEEFIRERGVFQGEELNPVLAKSYVTYVESLKRSLQALGMNRRAADKVLLPLQIAAEIDRAKDGSGEAEGEGS
jgi:hypothetical protein